MRRSLFAPLSWVVMLCSATATVLSAVSTSALADPPGRVARLTQIAGSVSFSPAGEQDWEIAPPNRPVVTGDRLWADQASHAELQIGAAEARLGANTAVTVLNLDDNIGQFQLAQGTLNVRVRDITGDQFYEVDTPNLAFSIRQPGDYRVDVDPSGNTTFIQVRSGQGEAWGEGTAYTIDAGQQYTFAGEGLQNVQYNPLPSPDEFDRWCFDRNRREDAAVASRYVPPQMVGYSDLDEYGTWRNVEGYGTVWVPTAVAPGWVPYHYGHWAWVEPWGWTWVDDAPWGFAPFHYGRWAFLSAHWCWVPGPIRVRPVYAPALVAFVGGGGFSLSISTGPVAGVAWFPLGVGEVYRPSYAVSRNYFTSINVSNTVINTTYVTNVYNNPNVQINYRNREVTNAITAVPANAFAGGEPVERHAVAVSRDVVTREPVTNVAAVTPSHASVLAAAAAVGAGAAVAAAHRPPAQALSRQVVARSTPPAPIPSFAARQSLLSSQPGRPLEAEKMKSLRVERAAEAPKLKMVSPNVAPRALEKGVAKGGPAQGGQAQERFKGGPQGGPPGGQAAEERAMKERKAGPPSGVPQPPPSAQERFKGGPQGGPPGGQAAEERALKERKAGPPSGVPQPPPSAQERFKGGPQGGPPGGQAQEERAMKERKAGPQPGGGPPPTAQERFKGGPQGAPPGGQAQEERAMKERKAGPPSGVPQPPPTAQERFKGGPQGGPPGGQAQEERAMKERKAGPQPGGGPPPTAQERFKGGPQGGPPGGQAQQERAMKERKAGPQPGGGPPPGAQERFKGGPPPGQPQAAQVQRGSGPGAQGGGNPEARKEEARGKQQPQGKEKEKEKEQQH